MWVQLPQDGEPAVQVGLTLGGDLATLGLGELGVVAVDDLQRRWIVEAVAEMSPDERQEAGLGCARRRPRGVEGGQEPVE